MRNIFNVKILCENWLNFMEIVVYLYNINEASIIHLFYLDFFSCIWMVYEFWKKSRHSGNEAIIKAIQCVYVVSKVQHYNSFMYNIRQCAYNIVRDNNSYWI